MIDNPYNIEFQIDEEYAASVDEENLRAAAIATLASCDVHEAELTIVITSDEAVQALNRDYRGIDAPTDVLSFAAQEEKAGEQDLVLPPELAAEMDLYLGDIIIAFPYTMNQAARFDNSPAAELRLMVVHGVLHLLGDDHDTPEAQEAMWARQSVVLSQFGDHQLSPKRSEPHA